MNLTLFLFFCFACSLSFLLLFVFISLVFYKIFLWVAQRSCTSVVTDISSYDPFFYFAKGLFAELITLLYSLFYSLIVDISMVSLNSSGCLPVPFVLFLRFFNLCIVFLTCILFHSAFPQYLNVLIIA